MSFFHMIATTHRRRNCFKSINNNDRKLDTEANIKEGLVEAFQNFLSALGGWHPILHEIGLNEIGSEEAT